MKIKIILLLLLTSISVTIQLNAQKIAAGGWHSLVVCSDSTVKAFGENASGQLGNADNTDQNLPVTAIGLNKIISVSAGGDQLEAHSMALKADGTVWAWGSNIYGGLGNGNTNNTNVPGQVLLLSDVKAISVGGWHSVALKNDGTVWTWGWNTDGQLGDGSFTDRTVPAQVNGLLGITAIAAGTYHVLALRNDGTVWAWGDNFSGQIGDGTNIDRNTPVQVQGLTDVIKISAGRFFSLAVKSDGTVWTWGENLYGQLGIGNTTDSSIPVQVPGLVVATPAIVATGAFHCLVVKQDGTVWTWGRNTYGNLGDGTVVHKSSPVQMLDMNNVAGMAAGTNFSLLYKNDGTFWGCGRNASGQLGDGTFTQRNTATQATTVCSIINTFNGITDKGMEETIDVFPNPSSQGIFNFSFVDAYAKQVNECKINIYTLSGSLIHSSVTQISKHQHSTTIDLSHAPSGMYLASITINDKIYHQKLIIQE